MVALNLTISAVLSIVIGLLVLIFPKFLRVALGLYLLIIGILGLFNF